MKLNFKHIYEGWKNDLLPPAALKEKIIALSEHRLSFCRNCPHNSTQGKVIRFVSTCNLCGCVLSAKTKCLDEFCPDVPSKWEAVGTLEQDEEIQKALGDEDSL